MYKKNGVWYSSFVCRVCCNGKQIRVALQKDKQLSSKLEEKLKFQHRSGQHKKEIYLEDALLTYKNCKTNITKKQNKLRVDNVIWLFEYSNVDKIKDITPAMCINYISSLRGLATSTLNRKKQYIKSFFDFCIGMDWLDKNPALRLKPERDKREIERKYFTKDEINHIIEYAGEFEDFWVFLLETGIRCTDAWNLSKANFNGNWCKWFENKNKRWVSIPLNKKAMEIVNRKQGVLFPEFKFISTRRKALKALQTLVPNAKHHTFRHTYAQNAGNNGVSKEILQRLLGHRSITTTEKYFNDINDQSLQDYVNNC